MTMETIDNREMRDMDLTQAMQHSTRNDPVKKSEQDSIYTHPEKSQDHPTDELQLAYHIEANMHDYPLPLVMPHTMPNSTMGMNRKE